MERGVGQLLVLASNYVNLAVQIWYFVGEAFGVRLELGFQGVQVLAVVSGTASHSRQTVEFFFANLQTGRVDVGKTIVQRGGTQTVSRGLLGFQTSEYRSCNIRRFFGIVNDLFDVVDLSLGGVFASGLVFVQLGE